MAGGHITMRKLGCSILAGSLLWISAGAEAATIEAADDGIARSWRMPTARDMVRLAWVQGPPVLQAFSGIDQHLRGFRERDALLGFRGGEWGMLFDPRAITVERLTVSATTDLTNELLDLPAMQQHWDAASLALKAVVGGKTYRPIGGPIKKDAPDYSPIHIIESGDWFQHVAVYDLELRDDSGELLDAKSRLEIRAWGDHCLFEWVVESAQGATADLSISLSSGNAEQSAEATSPRVQLGVVFSDGKMTSLPDEGRDVKISAASLNDYTHGDPQIRYSKSADAWEILIPKQDWPTDGALAYNKVLLDRVSRFSLALENTSNEPRDVRLRFVHDHHPLTGYVPMMLDAQGRQTGLPIQNSKNWHIRQDDRQPYDGEWIRQTTRVRLEPKARVSWQYTVPHALWQGVPLSSAAQLSLVGWGFNGFWVQMALGSWGETLCIQPGRTMRRAFITDLRPFMVLGQKSGKPYDWTSNLGGGDFAKLVDTDGKLVMWQGAVTDFKMIGPNLSHVRVTERTQDDSMRMTIDTYLPRSSSLARSYFKVRLDVLKDVAFSDFTLFQLGSDYYNEPATSTISWGNASGHAGSAEPPRGDQARRGEKVRLDGRSPWVVLHGPPAETEQQAAAVRGAIVRDYRAIIGGKENEELWLVSSKAAEHLSADLTQPSSVDRFRKGDRIEFLLELIVAPTSAEVYCGTDAALKDRLLKMTNSWAEIAHQARNGDTEVNGKLLPFPATLAATTQPRTRFTVTGSSGLHTLCLSGLRNPATWQIGDIVAGDWRPLGERFAEESSSQLNFDPVTATWTAVLSLVFPQAGGTREFEYRLNQDQTSAQSR